MIVGGSVLEGIYYIKYLNKTFMCIFLIVAVTSVTSGPSDPEMDDCLDASQLSSQVTQTLLNVNFLPPIVLTVIKGRLHLSLRY